MLSEQAVVRIKNGSAKTKGIQSAFSGISVELVIHLVSIIDDHINNKSKKKATTISWCVN